MKSIILSCIALSAVTESLSIDQTNSVAELPRPVASSSITDLSQDTIGKLTDKNQQEVYDNKRPLSDSELLEICRTQ